MEKGNNLSDKYEQLVGVISKARCPECNAFIYKNSCNDFWCSNKSCLFGNEKEIIKLKKRWIDAQ